MQIQENISLITFHTFKLPVNAQYFIKVDTLDVLKDALSFAKQNALRILVLGEGSNVIFCDNFPGLVIKIALQGQTLVAETEQYYQLKANAGENWHNLVCDCLRKNYFGLENLTLIPGTVGAAPVQNIGAYGVELADVFHSLTAVHRETLESIVFSKSDCQFGYRDSVFKQQLREQFVITSVTLNLYKDPVLETSYAGLNKKLRELNQTITPKLIFEVVSQLRQQKLPDPQVLANVGSFFKNPIISVEQFARLSVNYPDMSHFRGPSGQVKISAAWLIEKSGLKGYEKNHVSITKQHALVLANDGKATPKSLFEMIDYIQTTILEKFQISLEVEPFIYP